MKSFKLQEGDDGGLGDQIGTAAVMWSVSSPDNIEELLEGAWLGRTEIHKCEGFGKLRNFGVTLRITHMHCDLR